MGRHPRVVATEELDWRDAGHGSRYALRRKAVGDAVGAQKLGCSLYSVPPGKRPFPYHLHHAIEESMYILEGEGTLRLAGEEIPVRSGDYIALVAGPEGVHQVVNTGSDDLRFLCLSTMDDPDVTEYPETGKIGVFAGFTPGAPSGDRRISGFYSKEGTVGYWDGED